MAQTHAKNSHDLPNSNSKTVSLTFHLYPRHYTEFVAICEELEKFHSEILRDLVIDFIKKHKEKPQKREAQDDIDTLGEPQKKEPQKQLTELETYLKKLAGDSGND